MTKADKIKRFNPNSVGDINNNIFGLPFTLDEAEIVIVPVPWEVTVSYSPGTARGPEAVFNASFQIDLYDPDIPDAWKIGVAMDDLSLKIRRKSAELRKKTEEYIKLLEKGTDPRKNIKMRKIREQVNIECAKMNLWVKERVQYFMKKGKLVGILGGDHSTPLGMIQAIAARHNSFGILQIDAHADLRDAYEGFEFSHASIMFNALKIKQVKKLVQVGIRDYCEEESNRIKKSNGRIITFFDKDIKHQQFEGKTWKEQCKDIITALPENIYLSFDIDGLDPKLCPNTGTPVAGGFEVEQILYLVHKITEAGIKIIAFDINEISPGKDEWDANVGARLLYRIANLVAKSNGRA